MLTSLIVSATKRILHNIKAVIFQTILIILQIAPQEFLCSEAFNPQTNKLNLNYRKLTYEIWSSYQKACLLTGSRNVEQK